MSLAIIALAVIYAATAVFQLVARRDLGVALIAAVSALVIIFLGIQP